MQQSCSWDKLSGIGTGSTVSEADCFPAGLSEACHTMQQSKHTGICDGEVPQAFSTTVPPGVTLVDPTKYEEQNNGALLLACYGPQPDHHNVAGTRDQPSSLGGCGQGEQRITASYLTGTMTLPALQTVSHALVRKVSEWRHAMLLCVEDRARCTSKDE